MTSTISKPRPLCQLCIRITSTMDVKNPQGQSSSAFHKASLTTAIPEKIWQHHTPVKSVISRPDYISKRPVCIYIPRNAVLRNVLKKFAKRLNAKLDYSCYVRSIERDVDDRRRWWQHSPAALVNWIRRLIGKRASCIFIIIYIPLFPLKMRRSTGLVANLSF